MKAQEHFGVALRRLRTERQLTQEELAGEAGLSVQYVRRLEAGRNNPTLSVLFDIGRALAVHPADMLREIPPNAETRDPERRRPGPAEGTARPEKVTPSDDAGGDH